MKKQGISLITLVVTIVIIIILAGAVILNLSGDNPIKSSTKAKVFLDIDSFSSELTLSISHDYIKNNDIKNINLLNEEEILKYIPSMKNKKVGSTLYTDILVVLDGRLAVNVTKSNEAIANKKLTQEQYEWVLEALGYNVFNAQTYVIKYYKNDGTEEHVESSKVHDAKYSILSNTLEREKYRFRNWNTAPDGTGITYNVGDEYVGNEELILYAQWELKEISVLDVKNNAEAYYGDYVEYIPQNGCDVKWRIFYADDTNIYLMAADFVPNSYITVARLKNNGPYCVYSINADRKELRNILTNTEYYEEFKDEAGKAMSVVGVPTLEQFIESYNAVNEDNKIESYYYTAANKTYGGYTSSSEGYAVKLSSATKYNHDLKIPTTANKYDLYMKNIEGNSTYGYFLASYSANGADGLVGTSCAAGYINYAYTGSSGGRSLCPIVTLKPDVKLVDTNGDGIWEIE